MENIINDKYYADTKEFIWDCITKEFLSINVKKQLIEYYGTLNSENAMITYNEVTKIYTQAVNQNKYYKIGYTCSVCLLVGVGMSLFGYIGKKLAETNYSYKTSNAINGFGLCTLGFGIIMILNKSYLL